VPGKRRNRRLILARQLSGFATNRVGRKVIAVGATGAQGGGLVRAILDDPNGGFAARVLTQDAGGAKAKDFARLGAEVVTADVDNPKSLTKAFEGAYGAFCVTFFWAHFSPEKEWRKHKQWR